MNAAPRLLRGAFVLAMGGVGMALAIVLPGLTAKSALFGVAGLGTVLLLIMSGRPKEVLLGGYIIALTYNRQYFSFEWLTGDQHSQGLYWIPADLFLVALIAVSLLEHIRPGVVPRAASSDVLASSGSPSIVAAAMPALLFMAVFILSALLAERPDWSFNELTRVLRFVVVLVWLHLNMTRALWFTAVGTLALSALLQAGLGTLQVLLHADRSLLSVLGGASETVYTEGGEIDMLENRARGTLGHPNYLAPYLLFLLPGFLGALLYSRVRLTRLLSLGLLLMGIAGMIATKSRAPILLTSVALLLVALIAVRDRVLSLTAAAATAVVATTALALAAIPFADVIYQRIAGDWSASVTFRTEYNQAAIAIWNDAPLLGIGPNNGVIGLARHSPLFSWLVKDLETLSGGVPVRAVAPVHNVYLLFLAETGVLGLSAFVALLATVLWRMVRGYRAAEGAVSGICLGLAVGMVAQLVQQTLDFSLWFDPSWYTLAVLMAVVGTVPSLRPVLR
ncbi:MAG: O-antigen ligase family protein [Acetobacteraceae bacterium]|nr:O-antigen ligase family protein [Acetobacteraceae bacterium]